MDSTHALEQTTLSAAIQLRAEMQPDQPAIIASGFAPFYYRDLQSLLRDFRAALRAAGLSRSSRIAIAMPNGPQAALAITAVACSDLTGPEGSLTLSIFRGKISKQRLISAR